MQRLSEVTRLLRGGMGNIFMGLPELTPGRQYNTKVYYRYAKEQLEEWLDWDLNQGRFWGGNAAMLALLTFLMRMSL